MSDEDQDQKTEDPTGKRLSEAREKGQLPISREVPAWTLFAGILITFTWLGLPTFENLMREVRVFIEMPDMIRVDDRGFQAVIYTAILKATYSSWLVLLMLAAATILGYLSQNGLFYSFDLLKFDWARLSWVAGVKRIFSMNALFEFGKGTLKFLFLGFLSYIALKPAIDGVLTYADHPLMEILAYIHDQSVHLIAVLLGAFTVIAVADLFYRRYEYIKNLKMTKTEVKDEYKQQEGDPNVKSRLRQLRMEKARKRMMANVPKADVVITNPTHYAVALRYDSEKHGAPVVVAKGINLIADKIREIAEESRVPLVSNPPLARALHDTVELDRAIPPEHFKAVAEIISYVYKLKKRKI